MPSLSPEPDRWFAEEVQPHETALRAYLRGRFPTLKDIDDLVQEAYARLFRARKSGHVANARAYLFSTARNAAYDLFRRHKILTIEPLTENVATTVLTDSVTAAETASLNQELEILAEAMQSLPDRCRQVLMLRRIYGMSQKETAAALGIAEHTVEKQVGIGLRRCVEFLRRRGVAIGENSHGRR